MLGSLARWLRILGYDTAYRRAIEDTELVELCVREDRIALTRDRRLVRRRALSRWLLVEGVGLGAQLREVLRLTGDDPFHLPLLTRCVECNDRLEEAPEEAVAERVPPYVLQTQSRFLACPACQRVFWAGTHREKILRRLRDLLEVRRI